MKRTVLDDAARAARLLEEISATQERIAQQFGPMLIASERIAQQFEPMLAASERIKQQFEPTLAASERIKQQFEPMLAASERIKQQFEPMLAASERIKQQFGPMLGSGSPTADFQRFVESFAGRAALADITLRLQLPALEALKRVHFPELDALSQTVERHRSEILGDVPEDVRQVRISAMVRAIVEGATGFETQADTPEKKVKLLVQVFVWLVQMMIAINAAHHERRLELRREAEVAEQRAEIRRQAETIAALAEITRQLQQELREHKSGAPTLRVTQKSILRAAPTGDAPRVTTLRTDTQVRLISTVEAWYFVEVLDTASNASGVRGWLYRRNLEFARSGR